MGVSSVCLFLDHGVLCVGVSCAVIHAEELTCCVQQ